MKLSVTSWSFPQCSLSEAAGLSKLLNIHAIDLGYFYRTAINKTKLIEDPEGLAEMIRKLDITVPCLYHLFGDDIKDRNLSLKDTNGKNKADLQKAALFCRKAGIETIFMMPKDTYTFLSSRIVKEIAFLGGNVSPFVPGHVRTALARKVKPVPAT